MFCPAECIGCIGQTQVPYDLVPVSTESRLYMVNVKVKYFINSSGSVIHMYITSYKHVLDTLKKVLFRVIITDHKLHVLLIPA